MHVMFTLTDGTLPIFVCDRWRTSIDEARKRFPVIKKPGRKGPITVFYDDQGQEVADLVLTMTEVIPAVTYRQERVPGSRARVGNGREIVAMLSEIT